VTDGPVRLVIDVTAALEYARGTPHVGELLIQLQEAGHVAALPVGCLVEAYPAAVESERLATLVTHDAVVLVADDPDDWETLGHLCALTGGAGSASAALVALDADCWVLTADPIRYAAVAAGELTDRIEN
jgi:hypothetical protein